jgi:hypothetical protein
VIALTALFLSVAFDNCSPSFQLSSDTSNGASLKLDCESRELDVFARKYYPLLRAKCISCHDGSYAPNNRPDRLFASADIAIAFGAFRYSDDRYLLVARNAQLESHAGAGHTGPENSSTIQAAQAELEIARATPECIAKNGVQAPTIVLSPRAASLSAIQTASGLQLTWSLDNASDIQSQKKMLADLTGVKIQVTVRSHGNLAPSYLISAPKLETGTSGFKLKGFFVTLNGVVKDDSTTFSLLNADFPALVTLSTPTSLLSDATMVINATPADQDQIGLKLLFDEN